MDSLSIYFLFLIAIFAGWLMGRFTGLRGGPKVEKSRDIFEDYFVGLNYLLNDEPDEAIDTFIDALEINSETIETHLALGALLRRRGKVDKAIKVHQALLARTGLAQELLDATRLQLAIDYISAGLLDRAERLLNEILEENSPSSADALHHLITVYQTEKEWENAINSSQQLLANTAYKKRTELTAAAAHYCCELGEQFLSKNLDSKAWAQTKRAFGFDKQSVRASLLLAKIEQRAGNFKAVLKELARIRSKQAEFVGLLIAPLSEAHEQMGTLKDFEKLLRHILSEQSDVGVALALCDLLKIREGDKAAMEFLQTFLETRPSLTGLEALLQLQIPQTTSDLGRNLKSLQRLISRLLHKNPAYRCTDCGYESKNLYWLCPSCNKWDKIKPIPQMSEE